MWRIVCVIESISFRLICVRETVTSLCTSSFFLLFLTFYNHTFVNLYR